MILCDSDPLEVCILKKHLANLTCKCSVCEHRDNSESYNEELRGSNKEIQVGSLLNLLNQNVKNDTSSYTNLDFLCNQVSCPGCYIALNLLKGRETKIFKDEETETWLGYSCCDKSSGKSVKFIDRTTSTSNLKPAHRSSDTSLNENNTKRPVLTGIMKKRSNDHVTFSNYPDDVVPKQELPAFYGHCFCLQNFIDTIRPTNT